MIAQADAIRIPLADKSVHTVCTSPPYWGLRKYSGDQGRIWGGDPECEHEWGNESIVEGPKKWDTATGKVYPTQTTERVISHGQFCRLCGAWYGSLGLEPTPEQHIENIVGICREVRRVLRDDGVFWINYGDCFAGSGGENANTGLTAGKHSYRMTDDGTRSNLYRNNPRRERVAQGSLMMMPHRVALALQQDGWIIRQDLVWFKRNPMPESIAGTRWVQHRIKEGRSKHAADHNIKGGTQKMLEDASVHQGIDEDWVPEYVDCPGCEKCIPNDGLVLKRGSFRHTRAHEYIFQLVKGPKMKYWSNQEAVREGFADERMGNPGGGGQYVQQAYDGLGHENPQSGLAKGIWNEDGSHSGRNPRSVLDIPTAPYKGAHYATFPPNLIAPLIRATCPRWACPVCGQGWAAVVEKGELQGRTPGDGAGYFGHLHGDEEGQAKYGSGSPNHFHPTSVLGYKPTCEHPHTQEEAVPGTVFDPFVGSGTTVAVAKQLLRRGIGIDISMEYLDQQARIRAGLGTPSDALDDLPLFAETPCKQL